MKWHKCRKMKNDGDTYATLGEALGLLGGRRHDGGDVERLALCARRGALALQQRPRQVHGQLLAPHVPRLRR